MSKLPFTPTQELPQAFYQFCHHIQQAGGEAWLVGGSVRDLCLKRTPNDMDVEVYGLEEEQFLKVAQHLGNTIQVGQQFGVFKLTMQDITLDLALPRKEIKNGDGHRAFDVTIDAYLPRHIAALRRDFTINAMMFNPLTREFQDYYGGLDDLKNGILRHVSPAFAEDPLRVLRAMQFAARLNMCLDHETARLCRGLLNEAKTLPESRIWGEWQKWAHAPYPAKGLEVLRDSGWLTLYPELEALIGCEQDSRWHPEGDAWTHTLMVCNQAAHIAQREHLDTQHQEYLLFAALCHDLGKPATSFTDKNGHIRSPNHSEAGMEPSRHFLQRIAAPKRIAPFVLPLVYDHITHLCCQGQPSSRAVRRLAHRLEPASIELWEMLVEADASGRHPSPPCRPALPWLEKAKALQSHQGKVEPIIHGKWLIAHGVQPGKTMGDIIQKAYQAQLNGEFHDEATAETWLQTSF